MISRVILFVLCSFSTLVARGAVNGRDMVREKEIEESLTQIEASQLEPFRSARVAFDHDDYATAARLLESICVKLPRFDPAVRRLGAALAAQGRQVEGVAWAEKAVAINRSEANLSTLASILAFPQSGRAEHKDQLRALKLAQESLQLPGGGDASTLAMITQLGFALDMPEVSHGAVQQLQAKFPDLMQTHFFAAYIAAEGGHWMRADSEMRRARVLGAPRDAADPFLAEVHDRATGWRVASGAGIIIGAWLLGLVVLSGSGVLLSKLTLRRLDEGNANQPVSAPEHRMRQVYRRVLAFAGVYYYISLPIVLVLVILTAAAIIYGFMAIGFLPIKLIVILGGGAIVTVWSMGKSVFLRVKTHDPGRVLLRSEAEGLWTLCEEVARDVKTRPVDEIRLTVGTDLCVYERGSWRRKMDDKGERVLVLGAAVLTGFKQEDFRSVLAHEYGHFTNRDTAGGEIAMRVQNDILKFYFAMREAGQATAMNVAFHFLRFYHFIFRRISAGATRLQEVLADRVAAQLYGAPAFEGGLRHVIHRSIEFDSQANLEIERASKSMRRLNNFYEVTGDLGALKTEFETRINRPTTADDTHPGPQERFRRIAQFTGTHTAAAPGYVWDLFQDRQAIMDEMLRTIEKRLEWWDRK